MSGIEYGARAAACATTSWAQSGPPTSRPLAVVRPANVWGGGHGVGYMGLPATTWVPMGGQVPVLSPNHHPNSSQGQKVFMKIRFLEDSHVPLNSLIHRENG